MNPLTVSQVNTYIKALLDEAAPLRSIYISGEISNFLHYFKSGHMYFTLKDSNSQIKAVMFSSYASKLKFKPENGMSVICYGRVSTYEKDGVYQVYVQDMQPSGVGSLTIAFEQLKEKLESKGYFDESHKVPIPKYPNKIGVATSNMGAAVEDIKNILSRRYPLAEVVIVPTLVQGESASKDIANSIRYLDDMDDIDVIIVGRGGGSIEDLWAFNTEIVADAVYECRTPIISAVGHETDYTICDFVSDLRAPTPSAAAELAVPDFKNELMRLNNLSLDMEKAIDFFIEQKSNEIEQFKKYSVIGNVQNIFNNLSDRIASLSKDIQSAYKNIIDCKENQLVSSVVKLDALSPLGVLSRGYALALKDGKAVKTVKDLDKNDILKLKFNDGVATATIDEVIVDEE